MLKLLAALARLWSITKPAPNGAGDGKVNLVEIFRSIIVGLSGGGAASLLVAILDAVSSNAAAIFAPSTVGLATALIGLVLELLRRVSHDTPAVPDAKPAPTVKLVHE